MRVDSLSPKTWLLTGVAGWAVCLWTFSLLGLGSRLGDASDDTQQQRLPPTTIPRADRPGVQAQYVEIGQRPIFSEDRKPQPFTIEGNGEAAPVNTFDYVLTSILISSTVQLAILKPPADGAQSVRVKVGDAVETAPQWSLASLQPRSAVFRGPEGEKTLELRVFNGVGGAAPTAPAPTAVINETLPGPGGVVPQPPPVAPPPIPQPVANADGAGGNVSTEAQLDAIRKRIEARRAQIRQQTAQEAQNPGTPGQNPGQTP